jgi:hypothetical protein
MGLCGHGGECACLYRRPEFKSGYHPHPRGNEQRLAGRFCLRFVVVPESEEEGRFALVHGWVRIRPQRPPRPDKKVHFRWIELQKEVVAYTAGAAHGAAPGVHAPIGVALRRDGEVWTWGSDVGRSPWYCHQAATPPGQTRQLPRFQSSTGRSRACRTPNTVAVAACGPVSVVEGVVGRAV